MDCTSCTKYAGGLIDHRGLCRLFGPLNKLECCKNYTEQISDKIILKGNFCYKCICFIPEQSPEKGPSKNYFKVNGFCYRYQLGIFDGSTRKACSKYEQVHQFNITYTPIHSNICKKSFFLQIYRKLSYPHIHKLIHRTSSRYVGLFCIYAHPASNIYAQDVHRFISFYFHIIGA